MFLAEPQLRLATAADAGAVSALPSAFSHAYLVRPTTEQAAAFFATISEPAIRALIGRADMTYIVAEAPQRVPPPCAATACSFTCSCTRAVSAGASVDGCGNSGAIGRVG